MKRLLPLLLAGVAGIAIAQTPAEPPTAGSDADAPAATNAAGPRAGDDIHDRNCLRDTGSRITAAANAQERRRGKKETNCASSPGRSYSRDDIQSTGETNAADALRKLDPSLR